MLPYCLATKLLFTVSLLWMSACETSTGSLISEDVQELLAPVASQAVEDITGSISKPIRDVANESPWVVTSNALPLVTSVSPTITIRGANIVLLIHGENLSDNLSVHLDDEADQCLVSELGNTTNGIVQTNLIEAECATRGISDRILSVTDASGNKVNGSPITFTGTSITVSTTSRKSTSIRNTDSPTDTSSVTEDRVILSKPLVASTPDFVGVIDFMLLAPTNLQQADSTEFIKLSWDEVEHAQGYSIFVSNTTNPQPGVRGTTTYISYSPSIQIADFDIDQVQYIVVKAFANNRESASSAELRVDVRATLRTPYGVQTEISKQGDTAANLGVYLSDKPSLSLSLDQSANGRFTVFLSQSTNLVSTPTLGHIHVYLHDKDTGVVTLVSQSSTGIVGNANSSSPKISADGNNIVFVSKASNLDERVAAASGVSNVFSRNLITEKTNILSVSALLGDLSANANSFDPIIDDDGENIVYGSYASDLTTTGKTQSSHLFHFSSSSKATKVIPTSRSTLLAPNGYAQVSASAISGNGEFVFYRFDLPGTPPSLHRLSLSAQSQVNLQFHTMIGLGGSYIRSVTENGSVALIAYSNGQRSGLYDFVRSTFRDIGKWSNNTIPKGLSNDGKTLVFWSQDDLMPNNGIYNSVSGTHFVLDTQTNSLQETSQNIHDLSGDGNVLLYTEQNNQVSQVVQLGSSQR
ncbi:MAG: hypothetical protein ACI9XK_001759 [Granulosicoccus sp.]|jgi:hypothetical protein